jgi:uncharacterized protein (DUF1810 family)
MNVSPGSSDIPTSWFALVRISPKAGVEAQAQEHPTLRKSLSDLVYYRWFLLEPAIHLKETPMPPANDSQTDPFDLQRFVNAQEGIYKSALAELHSGRKRTHWMWFVFPQIQGLGFSPTSKRYAIRSSDEARAYLDHPVLGKRLVECAEAVLSVQGRSASAIFGSPDDIKLKSSMTLFDAVSAPGSVFSQVLERYFQGQRDRKTLDILGAG